MEIKVTIKEFKELVLEAEKKGEINEDSEIDFYEMQASEENREPLKSVFRNEFEKLSSMKSDVDTCINALVNKGDKE